MEPRLPLFHANPCFVAPMRPTALRQSPYIAGLFRYPFWVIKPLLSASGYRTFAEEIRQLPTRTFIQ